MSQRHHKPTWKDMCKYCSRADEEVFQNLKNLPFYDPIIEDEVVATACSCYRMSRLITLGLEEIKSEYYRNIVLPCGPSDSVIKRNLEKSVLVINNQKIKVKGVEYFKIIDNHPFWSVKFKDARLLVLVREDELYTQDDVDEEEIKYSVGGISYVESCVCYCMTYYGQCCRDCDEDDLIPLVYLHMKRVKY